VRYGSESLYYVFDSSRTIHTERDAVGFTARDTRFGAKHTRNIRLYRRRVYFDCPNARRLPGLFFSGKHYFGPAISNRQRFIRELEFLKRRSFKIPERLFCHPRTRAICLLSANARFRSRRHTRAVRFRNRKNYAHAKRELKNDFMRACLSQMARGVSPFRGFRLYFRRPTGWSAQAGAHDGRRQVCDTVSPGCARRVCVTRCSRSSFRGVLLPAANDRWRTTVDRARYHIIIIIIVVIFAVAYCCVGEYVKIVRADFVVALFRYFARVDRRTVVRPRSGSRGLHNVRVGYRRNDMKRTRAGVPNVFPPAQRRRYDNATRG